MVCLSIAHVNVWVVSPLYICFFPASLCVCTPYLLVSFCICIRSYPLQALRPACVCLFMISPCCPSCGVPFCASHELWHSHHSLCLSRTSASSLPLPLSFPPLPPLPYQPRSLTSLTRSSHCSEIWRILRRSVTRRRSGTFRWRRRSSERNEGTHVHNHTHTHTHSCAFRVLLFAATAVCNECTRWQPFSVVLVFDNIPGGWVLPGLHGYCGSLGICDRSRLSCSLYKTTRAEFRSTLMPFWSGIAWVCV